MRAKLSDFLHKQLLAAPIDAEVRLLRFETKYMLVASLSLPRQEFVNHAVGLMQAPKSA